MKIGIIGGPGSGKTKLAKTIHRGFPEYKVIDRYVERLSKRMDTAAGVAASHLMNSAIAIERVACELEAGADNFITCGTIIDTLAYDAVYGLAVANPMVERSRIQNMMSWLGMMTVETFLYDRVIFLPSEDEGFDWQLQYAFKLFGIAPAIIEDKKFDDIIEPLKEYEKAVNETSETE